MPLIDPVSSYIDKLLTPILINTGLTLDIAKSICALVITFSFALLWPRISGGNGKHITSALFGSIFLVFTYGIYQAVVFYFQITVAYILLKIGIAQLKPWVMFISNISILSLTHLYFYFTAHGIWRIDITAALMISVQNCTSLAWNLHDGLKQAEINREQQLEQNQKQKTPVVRAEHLTRMMITEVPNLIQFLGYVLFPVSISYGPSSEFTMYLQCSKQTELPKERMKYVITNLIQGLLMVSYFFHVPDFSFVFDPVYLSKPWFLRTLQIQLLTHWIRLRYYSAWCLTTSAMILCGAGYDGHSWEGSSNIHPLSLESASKPRDFIARWNSGTQRFLKYYIYFRGPKNPKTGLSVGYMQYVTFLISAFWHGWYPCYAIHFTIDFLLTLIDRLYFDIVPSSFNQIALPYGLNENERKIMIERNLKKEQDKQQGKKKKITIFDYVKTFIEWILTQQMFNFAAAAAYATETDKVIACYSAMNYWTLIVIAILLSILIPLNRIKKSKLSIEQKKKQNGKDELNAKDQQSLEQGEKLNKEKDIDSEINLKTDKRD
ncbi:MAG: lysophospholipid acyltransferase [Streblomastix strix]|uniref:Lysophospholipid acyltransferase n=1 Tax=Streblomastix strix TaxID=222440 RepID=A0A5J4WIW9_9EUKA|nr:MAG: lysophospholipid acyltransferase [Streblomastix strix]